MAQEYSEYLAVHVLNEQQLVGLDLALTATGSLNEDRSAIGP